ncbi:MAG: shikimate dehydrogenase [Proteobacteria bacterium]|nr:shikimate dehydrogenase [Pseudomonadota bacterium]
MTCMPIAGATAEAVPGNIEIFCLFGNPVAQSLSPLMHNAAFAKLGLKAVYTACRATDAAEVVRMVRDRGIRGASITIPFKETVMTFLDEVEESAREIGAVNTIVNRGGRLSGYNTDGTGLVRDLAEWLVIRGKTFIVLGAGGAARAAVFALLQEGGIPIIVNRMPGRAEALADRFGCRWVLLPEIGHLYADCLINTTSVGMFPDTDRRPLEDKFLVHFPHVMDMIYNPIKTRLLREAEAAGCAVRSGVGMFVHQGAEQIRLWTGMEPPRKTMRQAVLERLGENGGD